MKWDAVVSDVFFVTNGIEPGSIFSFNFFNICVKQLIILHSRT